MDLALNNLQMLICNKTETNKQTKSVSLFLFILSSVFVYFLWQRLPWQSGVKRNLSWYVTLYAWHCAFICTLRQKSLQWPGCSTHERERIYCHPQTDCFVVSQLFSAIRHAGRFNLESKPTELYTRLGIQPLRHIYMCVCVHVYRSIIRIAKRIREIGRI